MVRRSVLFTPGDSESKVRGAVDSGADVVVFDLEDGVAPANRAEAREIVRDGLDAIDEPGCERWVRVTPTDVAAEADLRVALDGDSNPDAVVLPKVGSPAEVVALRELLPDDSLPIVALVETAAGVLNARGIAASEGVDALLFGAEDLAADIGATRTDEGTEVLHAREHVVLAASAAGIDAIDAIDPDFEDEDGLAADAAFAAQLGYDGKMAIHPAQVPIINDAWTPDPERVAWAERVLDARDEAEARGEAVFRVDGKMIDQPLITQAEQILARAEAAETGEETASGERAE
jgi:citrate lyase subunit beta/citryl-CoA lyase